MENRTNKIEVVCPKCGTKNNVLWFSEYSVMYQTKGSTGRPSRRFDGRKEKVEGSCKDCGYKFKVDDLD